MVIRACHFGRKYGDRWVINMSIKRFLLFHLAWYLSTIDARSSGLYD